MSFNKYLKEFRWSGEKRTPAERIKGLKKLSSNEPEKVPNSVDDLTNSIINHMMYSGVDERFSEEAIGRMASNIVKDISDKIERIMS